ncbi:MAG TPA: hypothetical protein VF487_18355 [Chitinophagaceae bacterium]
MQAFINSASNAVVIAGMQKIKTDFLPNSIFLDTANSLGVDAVDAISKHFNPSNPTSFSFDDAKTYLAAASFVHCKDGWQYLSNAVDSIFKGDSKTAIHLAYYAELRAAMSFLASEGIGILNSVHYCLDTASNIIRDPKSNFNTHQGKFIGWGTHRFIWECLKSFSNSTHKNVNHLLESFWHNGLSFDKWIGHIPHTNSITVISEIIKLWIKEWSFDISYFKDDREGRNTASYGPSKFKDFGTTDCKIAIEAYSSSLRLLEPDSVNRFSLLDKYLFKLLFLKIYTEITNNGITISLSDLLDQTFVNAGKPMDASLQTIILSPHDHPLIAASKDTVIDTLGNIKPFTIFSRALLLSRVATGSVANLLKKAAITKNELDFFFNYCGVEHGFWKPASPIAAFEDLWTELSDSIIDIDTWVSTQPAPLDLRTFNDGQAENLTIYKQINRVNYWGIAI